LFKKCTENVYRVINCWTCTHNGRVHYRSTKDERKKNPLSSKCPVCFES
jgi:hypothetical protein